MVAYKDTPEAYIIKMLKEQGLDGSDLTKDELSEWSSDPSQW